MNESKFLPAGIVGGALVLSALIFGGFYYSAQLSSNKDVLSVTGSARTNVVSDKAKLVVSFSQMVYSDNLPVGYSNISRDLSLVKDLLKKSNVSEKNIIESPVSANQMYDNNGGNLVRYGLYQTVTIQLDDVAKITELSKKIPSIVSKGSVISVQSLEYYYSKLPDLRVSLLSDAVKDAKARAEKIAEGTGRKVGNVQTASSGVVQVLAPNSVDISDYGNYDTSSIEKDVAVTVKASFRLK